MNNPLNYIIIDKAFNDTTCMSTEIVRIMNYIIITDVENGTFVYTKNRYDNVSGTIFDISDLPKHIRRLNMNLGYNLTLYDEMYIKLRNLIREILKKLSV